MQATQNISVGHGLKAPTVKLPGTNHDNFADLMPILLRLRLLTLGRDCDTFFKTCLTPTKDKSVYHSCMLSP